MSKETKKRNNYNHEVVKALGKRWGVTPHYVRQCLRGDRKGIMSDTIKKEYQHKVNEVNKVLEK